MKKIIVHEKVRKSRHRSLIERNVSHRQKVGSMDHDLVEVGDIFFHGRRNIVY